MPAAATPGFRRLAVAVVPLLAVPAVVVPASATPAHAPVKAIPATGLDVGVAYGPQRFRGDDGREHIVVTATLTNILNAAFVPDGITVIAQDGRRLTHLDRAEITRKLEGVLSGPMPDGIAPSTTGVISFDMVAAPSITAIRLRVHYTLADGATLPTNTQQVGVRWTASSPLTSVLARKPWVLQSPVRGSVWFNQNACCSEGSHEYTRVSSGQGWRETEMFAIDFTAARNGFQYTGDGSQNTQWAGFGQPVYAASGGTVVSVRRDMPDIPPGTDPEWLNGFLEYGGNHVTIEMAPGVYAFYAHFQQNTVRVRLGQKVKAGAYLARLGNSGHTTAPHLHFQLTDKAGLTGGEGLPFVFSNYTRLGDPSARGDGTGAMVLRRRVSAQRDTYPLAVGAYRFPGR